jgi:hypothetical protein
MSLAKVLAKNKPRARQVNHLPAADQCRSQLTLPPPRTIESEAPNTQIYASDGAGV